MTDLLGAVSRVLLPLGEMSLTAAYAAGVVAALRLVLKKRAPRRVLCLLWLVVFARLLIPVPLESPVSIVPDARQVRQLTQQAPILPEADGGQTVSFQPAPQTPGQNHTPAQDFPQDYTGGVTADPVSQGGGGSGAPVLTAPGGAAPAPRPELPAPFPWRAVIAGVWLAGALAMGGFGLTSYLRLRRRLYDAIRAPDGAWEHPSVASPFILGVFRPKIYLPAGLRGQPRQFILCHERAHLRRLDHVVKPVCWAALAVHWFNPAVWLAYLLMSRDIEAACDEAVICRLGPEVKADYSATLLSLATGGRIPAPCPLAFDEGDSKGRIRNVLKYQRPALWIVVVSVIMAAMAAVCLLTDPVSAQTPEDDPAPSAALSQPLPESPLPAPSPEPAQAPAAQSPVLEDWMLEVLSGRRTFRRIRGDGGEFTIHELRSFFYGEVEPPQITVEAGKVTALDLDRDGENELIVFPEGDDEYLYSYVGYLILRRQGDETAAYAPGWRSIGSLKADGTFHWSNSGFHAGIGCARFTEDGGLEIEDITWFELHSEYDERYFVDGVQASREEFLAAQDAHQAKPEPIWYALEDGALRRMAPDIPMDAAAWSIPLPEFMTGAQQSLYQRAYSLYTHILGGNPAQIDAWPSAQPLPPAEEVEVDGQRYVPANGLYARWDDFESAVLSVFTQSFWNQRNRWEGKRYGEAYPLFINVDGRTYYHPMSRASGGYNGNFPETFRATEETDAALAFTMTGHYSNPCLLEGEDEAARAARYAAGYEYVIEFPLRMVNTEDGWRFEEFRCAGTDDLESPFIDHHNPILRTTPDTTRVTACDHGLDYVFLDKWNGQQILRCKVDRFPYVLPAPFTAYNLGGSAYDDMDGDGRDEHAFLTDDFSTLMVCDVEDGRLKTCTARTGPLLDDFIQNLDYRYTDSGGVLTLETSYQGQSIQTRFTGSNRELVLGYGEKDAPIPGHWSGWVESYTGQDVIICRDLYIEGSVERMEQSGGTQPVVLVGAVQWTFCYKNGELEYAPGGVRLIPLSEDLENHVY